MTIAQINEVCIKTYGSELVSVNPTTALWLAERILSEKGVNVYRKISNRRNKVGAGTDFPQFGSEVFKTL